MRPKAISKEEAVSQLSQEIEAWLYLAIPEINRRLSNFTPKERRYIDGKDVGLDKLTNEVRRKAVELIKAIYTEQHWKVEFNWKGQTDNDDWFSFS